MARATTRQQTSRQASRSKVKRKRRQQAKRWVLAVAGLCGLAVVASGGWQIYSSDLIGRAQASLGESANNLLASGGFRLRQINVEGREKTDKAVVMQAVGIAPGGSIFSMSLGDIRNRLETIDTVRRATVERRLPDELYVRLEERRPVAVWQSKQTLRVVDADGVVLEREVPEAHKHLLVVVGEDAPKHLPELFTLLNQEKTLLPEVVAAVRVGGRRWDLRLKNGVKVLLPEEEPSEALHKLAQWQKEKKILEKAISAIDFRLKERVFIRVSPEAKEKKPATGPAQEV